MKKMNQVIKYGSAVVLSSPVLAFAALPTTVSDAIDTSKTDVTTLGGLAFAVVLVVVGFNWFRRVAK